MLSKEELHKKAYLSNMSSLTVSVKALGDMSIVKKDPATMTLVKNVSVELTKLQSFKDQMIGYASDDSKNMPAMKF